MPLDPLYLPEVAKTLDEIENDDSRRPLWNAIATALNLICDEPESKRARAKSMGTYQGVAVWRVPIRVESEDHDWGIIWARDGNNAKFFYINPWPPLT